MCLLQPTAALRERGHSPKQPPQQETCLAAALSIFPPREGTEVAWDRDGATPSGPLAARGQAMLPASSHLASLLCAQEPGAEPEACKQHQIHRGSESAEIRGVAPAQSRISGVCGASGRGVGKPEASAGLGYSDGQAPCPLRGRAPRDRTPRSTAQGAGGENTNYF